MIPVMSLIRAGIHFGAILMEAQGVREYPQIFFGEKYSSPKVHVFGHQYT